jgi:hypothetical protein
VICTLPVVGLMLPLGGFTVEIQLPVSTDVVKL